MKGTAAGPRAVATAGTFRKRQSDASHLSGEPVRAKVMKVCTMPKHAIEGLGLDKPLIVEEYNVGEVRGPCDEKGATEEDPEGQGAGGGRPGGWRVPWVLEMESAVP